jgi:hypothetical protein
MTAPDAEFDITARFARWNQDQRAVQAELMRSAYPVLRDTTLARLRRADAPDVAPVPQAALY